MQSSFEGCFHWRKYMQIYDILMRFYENDLLYITILIVFIFILRFGLLRINVFDHYIYKLTLLNTLILLFTVIVMKFLNSRISFANLLLLLLVIVVINIYHIFRKEVYLSKTAILLLAFWLLTIQYSTTPIFSILFFLLIVIFMKFDRRINIKSIYELFRYDYWNIIYFLIVLSIAQINHQLSNYISNIEYNFSSASQFINMMNFILLTSLTVLISVTAFIRSRNKLNDRIDKWFFIGLLFYGLHILFSNLRISLDLNESTFRLYPYSAITYYGLFYSVVIIRTLGFGSRIESKISNLDVSNKYSLTRRKRIFNFNFNDLLNTLSINKLSSYNIKQESYEQILDILEAKYKENIFNDVDLIGYILRFLTYINNNDFSFEKLVLLEKVIRIVDKVQMDEKSSYILFLLQDQYKDMSFKLYVELHKVISSKSKAYKMIYNMPGYSNVSRIANFEGLSHIDDTFNYLLNNEISQSYLTISIIVLNDNIYSNRFNNKFRDYLSLLSIKIGNYKIDKKDMELSLSLFLYEIDKILMFDKCRYLNYTTFLLYKSVIEKVSDEENNYKYTEHLVNVLESYFVNATYNNIAINLNDITLFYKFGILLNHFYILKGLYNKSFNQINKLLPKHKSKLKNITVENVFYKNIKYDSF